MLQIKGDSVYSKPKCNMSVQAFRNLCALPCYLFPIPADQGRQRVQQAQVGSWRAPSAARASH
jgi:hypothetical protein